MMRTGVIEVLPQDHLSGGSRDVSSKDVRTGETPVARNSTESISFFP
jgi:hypothetical protein